MAALSQERKDHGKVRAFPMPQGWGAASQLQYHILCLKCQSHTETASKTKGKRALPKISLSPNKALRATELQTRKHRTPEAPRPGTVAAMPTGALLGTVSTSARASPPPALPHPLATRRPLPNGNRFSPALSQALHQSSEAVAQGHGKRKRYISHRQLPCASSPGAFESTAVGSFRTADEAVLSCWRFSRKG